jgi:ribosomal-protein-alanine N-acetyltransferase
VNEAPPRDTPVLETPRLLLRERVPGDAEALHPAFADAEVMHFWSSGPHDSVEQTYAYFAPSMWRAWVITIKGEDSPIGFVSAGEKKPNVSEIGYMLLREHWGRGIVGEALTAVIDRIFAEGHRRVVADIDPDNTASRVLVERLGFRLEGILRAEWETHIGVRDTALYGLLLPDWQEHRAVNAAR